MNPTTQTRLVNVHMVRKIRNHDGNFEPRDVVSQGCSGNPERMLEDARKSPFGIGVIITDVRTGERWFVPA